MNDIWLKLTRGIPFILTYLAQVFSGAINMLLQLLAGRLFFAALVLSMLIGIITPARKNCPPLLRSWLWTLCLAGLLLPFEHSVVFLANREIGMPLLVTDGQDISDLQAVLTYLWFAGFLCFSVRERMRRKLTLRLINSGKLTACAAYFTKLRSFVYLPPDFEQAYTPAQREMLISHEQQHIRQHDPLLFRVLQALQCVFWFCPPVYTAVRMIRHDRELLCDARVTRGCSKREYGLLLLSEAKKSAASHVLAGIAAGGVYERVKACAIPFSGGKKAAALVFCAAACVFAAGMFGVLHPICEKPEMVVISADVGRSLERIEGAERFVSYTSDGIAIDEKGLREFVAGAGYQQPEQRLSVRILLTRPTLTTCFSIGYGNMVSIAELEAGEVFFPHSRLMALYKSL